MLAIRFRQLDASRLPTYIVDFLVYLGVYAMADRLTVQHAKDPFVFVNCASFADFRVDVEHPLEKGHDILLRRSHHVLQSVYLKDNAVPISAVRSPPSQMPLRHGFTYLVHFFITP